MEHLDSLRGLAALGVAFHHALSSVANFHLPSILFDSFGYPQVLFFFVLSGFVLSRSINGARDMNREGMHSYLIRRFLRLYPAAVFSLIFAAVLSRMYTCSFSPFASEWLIHEIQRAQSVCTPWGYISSLSLKYPDLNGPLWTIRVEFWCSFFLPFILLTVTRKRVLRILVGVVFGVLFYCIGTKTTHIFVFYLGYLLFCLQATIDRLVTVRRVPLILACVIALWWLAFYLDVARFAAPFVQALILLAMIPCRGGMIHRVLISPPLRFLGRTSYSFYLVHCPILLFLWSLMERSNSSLLGLGIVSVFGLFFSSVIVSLPLAYFSQACIEKPMNDFGKSLAAWLASKLWKKQHPGLPTAE